MEFKHIKELMTVMGRTGTKKLTIKKEGFELQLEQQSNGSYEGIHEGDHDEVIRREHALRRAAAFSLHQTEIPGHSGVSIISSQVPLSAEKKIEVHGEYVTSPMVGTFYVSPSPEEPSFVKVGDKIEKNTVVCIIEAMKVMNEIKAEMRGVITEILVEGGKPVEFGQPLFSIKPA